MISTAYIYKSVLPKEWQSLSDSMPRIYLHLFIIIFFLILLDSDKYIITMARFVWSWFSHACFLRLAFVSLKHVNFLQISNFCCQNVWNVFKHFDARNYFLRRKSRLFFRHSFCLMRATFHFSHWFFLIQGILHFVWIKFICAR